MDVTFELLLTPFNPPSRSLPPFLPPFLPSFLPPSFLPSIPSRCQAIEPYGFVLVPALAMCVSLLSYNVMGVELWTAALTSLDQIMPQAKVTHYVSPSYLRV